MGCMLYLELLYSRGVHSTVRSEAINSVIASFCKTNSDMVTLIQSLENMVDHQLLKSESISLKHQFTSMISPYGNIIRHSFAEALVAKCTPYAAHIIRVQAAMAMLYGQKNITINIDDAELKEFQKSLGDDGVTVGIIQADESDAIPEWKMAMDYGLNDGGVKVHVSSWKQCSCQFYACYQLPCRHMFHCMMISPGKVKLEQLSIGSHWISKSPSHCVESILSTSKDPSLTMDIHTLDNRKKILSSVCSQMVEVASVTEGRTKECIKYVQDFIIRKCNREDHKGDDDSGDNHVVLSTLGMGNPPLMKGQKKTRILPMNPSAPTTKSYKRAGKQLLKKRNDEKKRVKLQSAGVIV